MACIVKCVKNANFMIEKKLRALVKTETPGLQGYQLFNNYLNHMEHSMDEENNIRYSIEKNTKVEHSNLIIMVQSKRKGKRV
jgi:hypothetical protein